MFSSRLQEYYRIRKENAILIYFYDNRVNISMGNQLSLEYNYKSIHILQTFTEIQMNKTLLLTEIKFKTKSILSES